MPASDAKEEIRSRIDLAALIGEYVPLRRAGSRMIARCPFHNEKTPSLSVDTERGLFHCFGCKASGDVFSFYERIENLGFLDALRALAERAGVELEHDTPPEARAERARQRELIERLYEASEVACKFFQSAIGGDDAATRMAQDELIRRRARRLLNDDFANQSIETFRVGYAPPTWQSLTESLRIAGVSPADAEMAGLIRQRKGGGGYYDVFRHRLMFPVLDPRGRVIAFSGRALPVTGLTLDEGIVPAETGKYINTAETPIFKKGETIFGLHAAKDAIREHQEAILVEGNFDVLSMHANGFTNTVAPLGTSFTEQHARLLRRHAETVYVMFDGDTAGRRATSTIYPLLRAVGIAARVVQLPPKLDPDEVLRSDLGRAAIKNAVARAPTLIEWLIDAETLRVPRHEADRAVALRAIAPLIAQVDDPVEREMYATRACVVLERSLQHLYAAMRIDLPGRSVRIVDDPLPHPPAADDVSRDAHQQEPHAQDVTEEGRNIYGEAPLDPDADDDVPLPDDPGEPMGEP